MTRKLKVKILVFLICLLFPYITFAGGSQQTSGVTVQTIVDQARAYLAESTADYWTDAQLLNIVNSGVLDIVSLTKCMETNEAVKLLTGVSEYTLSTNYLSVEAAIYSGTTTEYSDNTLKALKRVDIRDVAHRENVSEPVAYYLWNDRIGFDPSPESGVSGYRVTVYMIERPTTLTLTSALTTPAMYDDALVLFVVARALKYDKQFVAAGDYMAEYLARIQRFRSDYVQRPKE